MCEIATPATERDDRLTADGRSLLPTPCGRFTRLWIPSTITKRAERVRADPHHSIGEPERQAYTDAHARPGRMRAAWAYFESFPQAADDFARFSHTSLTMPVLSIGGAKANGEALARQAKLVASTPTSLILPDTGHWLMEQRPSETGEALLQFLSNHAATAAMPQLRVTANEIRARGTRSDQIGSSGLPGVNTPRPRGRSLEGRPVHDRAIRPGAHDHTFALAPGRSHRDGHFGPMAVRLRRPLSRQMR